MSGTKKQTAKPKRRKRSYVKQTDVPLASLDDALRVPKAILDNYAGEATSPLKLAKAMDIDPKGSQLRNLCGAAIAYGLTEGGAQAGSISITPLAKRILQPLEEDADVDGRREAILKPRVFGEFLRKYDQHALPRRDIARNVLVDIGVPEGRADEVLDQLEANAVAAGFVEEIKGKKHIDLSGVAEPPLIGEADTKDYVAEEQAVDDSPLVDAPDRQMTQLMPVVGRHARRVFITHGKNKALIDPIRKLLEYGELEAVVSVEKQSVSKPVPEKVMDDMRGCGAAIIHVDAEEEITDNSGKVHVILNPNVLIEIGAAMAFYGKRFILLVREGVTLPSNLQGLYEVRYKGTLSTPILPSVFSRPSRISKTTRFQLSRTHHNREMRCLLASVVIDGN